MLKLSFRALALATALIIPAVARAQFASSVVSYDSGAGFAAGFTNPNAAIGAPASGASVTPLAPPFSKNQIVSIGAGGEITLQFSAPILNNPADPYGINFVIFANEFFVTSGGNVSGDFSHPVNALVQVSQDGTAWYNLNPLLAPELGQLFPTDGKGDPAIPVNPSLTQADFNGQNLAGIRSLYDGSAGGTGYDLNWAVDSNTNSVDLSSIDYLRIAVQTGVIDLDAVSGIAAVPEASSTFWLLAIACVILFWTFQKSNRFVKISSPWRVGFNWHILLLALLCAPVIGKSETIAENFTSDPAADGWQATGDTSLFQWDSTNQNLAVTWDSSQANSYYYHPLSSVLGVQDAFSLSFDINLTDAGPGTDYDATNSPYNFELAVGFINLSEATDTNFLRGTGFNSPDLAEFDYFWDSGFGPSINASVGDSNSTFIFQYDDSQFMNPGVTYHVVLNHKAEDTVLTGTVYTYSNGELQVYSTLPSIFAESGFKDFFVDTIAISSYNDTDSFGSILAHGAIANLLVNTTPTPIGKVTGQFADGIWQTQFSSRHPYVYTLYRSTDLRHWDNVISVGGNGAAMTLQDPAPPSGTTFYRVGAARRPAGN